MVDKLVTSILLVASSSGNKHGYVPNPVVLTMILLIVATMCGAVVYYESLGQANSY